MASGLSRTCLGIISPKSRVLLDCTSRSSITRSAGSSSCNSYKLAFRGYTTTTALPPKPKASTTTKGTTKHVGSTTTRPTKVSVKTSARTTPKGTASSTAKPAAKVPDATRAVSPTSASGAGVVEKEKSAAPPTVEQKKEISDEEKQMKQLDHMMLMSQFMPTADLWGQKVVDTLDVILPQSVGFTSGITNAYRQFWRNRLNGGKNALSLLAMASEDAIPGVDLSTAKWTQKISKWPIKIFGTQSVKHDAWLTPLRQASLGIYQNVNRAVAREDVSKIKELSTASYQANTIRLIKRTKNPNVSKIWRFHHEIEPTRVLSIRATEGYLGNEPPKFGNRLMVHALVKFDTEQSLELYDHQGRALHTTVGDMRSDGTIAAEPKRVTEYLVMEKRMWYDGPWVIREQMYLVP